MAFLRVFPAVEVLLDVFLDRPVVFARIDTPYPLHIMSNSYEISKPVHILPDVRPTIPHLYDPDMPALFF